MAGKYSNSNQQRRLAELPSKTLGGGGGGGVVTDSLTLEDEFYDPVKILL